MLYSRPYEIQADVITDARFLVFTAVKIHIEVFWILTPRSVVVGYERFGGPYSIHLQDNRGLMTIM
jgi:hypothetical protein